MNIDIASLSKLSFQEYVNTFSTFSDKEVNQIIDYLIYDNELSKRETEDMMRTLCLCSFSTGESLPKCFFDFLIARRELSNAEFFLRATEETAKELIQIHKSKDFGKSRESWIIECIVAIKCESSKQFILNFDGKWDLKTWPHVFGWGIGNNNEIIELYSKEVIVFEDDKEGKSKTELAPLSVSTTTCGVCGLPLNMIYITPSGYRLATCLNCSCYDTIFVKQKDNDIEWYGEINTDLCESDRINLDYGIKVSNEKRNPITSVSEFFMQSCNQNQIGGMPTVIAKDIYYPLCPECGETMHFTAQFNTYNAEGLYYFFTCDKCKIHACNYNQT